MNKTVLFLSLLISIAGIYFIVFKEPEVPPAAGDIKIASDKVFLRNGSLEFTILNGPKEIFIVDVSGDCTVVPPLLSIKTNSAFKLTGECRNSSVYNDKTVDLVLTYKVKSKLGKSENKKQAVKLSIK